MEACLIEQRFRPEYQHYIELLQIIKSVLIVKAKNHHTLLLNWSDSVIQTSASE